MNEVIFVVEEAPEGGFTARALDASIFTEAGTLPELHERVRDAVRCHFEDADLPKLIRLHFVRDEVLSALDCPAIFPVPTWPARWVRSGIP